MFMRIARLFTLLMTLLTLSFAHAEESHVDFNLSPAYLEDGNLQVAFEWLTPNEFKKRDLSVTDLVKVQNLHPGNNQLIVSKTALLSKKPVSHFSLQKMNNAQTITALLRSVSAVQKSTDTWYVTNKVKAYGIPFKVSFNLTVREVTPAALGSNVVNYFRSEGSAFRGTGKELFYIMDMTNFSQLMYRNYSVIYIKEISPAETLVVAGIIAAFDINKANSFFNFPPFSSTEGTMVDNLRSQILHMARTFQK